MVERDFNAEDMRFVREVAQELQERTGLGIELRDIVTSRKDPYFGACVSFAGSNVSPVFHTDEWITWKRGGMTQEEVVEQMLGQIHEVHKTMGDMPKVGFTREEVLRNVRYGIASEELHGEFLRTVPHVRIDGTDLCLYPVGQVSDRGTYTVTNEMADGIGMKQEEILEAAQAYLESQPYTVRPMGAVLSSLTGHDAGYYDPPVPSLLVITNHDAIDGAVMVARAEVLEEARQMIQADDIYVLPSSRHEVLAIPAESAEPKQLEEMVRTINEMEVAPQDRLSNSVYKYDGQSLTRVETETRTRNKLR